MTSGWAGRLPLPFVLLFPIATVTVLLASNAHEGVRPENLFAPLITAILIGLYSWGIAAVVVRDRLRKSILGLLISIPLLVSGYLFAWLRGAEIPLVIKVGTEFTLILVWIGVAFVATRRLRWTPETARFLNLFGALTILLTLPSVYRTFSDPTPRFANRTALPDTMGLYRPDIYLIVLDGYSGRGSLLSEYGFDNEPFFDSLAVRGFVIPEESRSNYVKTFLSVGSMLNRDYYDELSPPANPGRDPTAYYGRMEVNRTIVDLKRLGYSFYYVGSSYPALASNRLADAQYSDQPSRLFERLWFRATVLVPALQLCGLLGGCPGDDVPFAPESAAETEDRIEFLTSLVSRTGQKFVYAHWLLPHGPFRFGPTCDRRESRWTIGKGAIVSDSLIRRLYIEQLQCTNRKLVTLVDDIRSTAPSSVIILQADHGYGRFPGEVPTRFEHATADQVRERFDAFAAYAGPRALADSLASQTSPVNVFRTLFRVLWDVDEPTLPDRYYWSEGTQSLVLREMELP